MRSFFILLITAIVFLCGPVQAQKTGAQVFTYVEQMPEFPGGTEQLMAYLSHNIRYPDAAREANIEGRVVVKFVISETGDVSDVTVLHKIGGGCDEEAVRVIKTMPRWKPGMQEGKPVKVYFTLPITFRLEGGAAADEYPAIAFRSKAEIDVYKEGMTALEAKHFSEAESAMNKAVAINPGNPYSYLAIGLIRLQTGDMNGCEAAFGKAYTASVKTDSLHRLAGGITAKYLLQAYTLNGKYDKALQLVQQERTAIDDASSLVTEYSKMIVLGKKTDAQLLALAADLGHKWDNCEAMAELGRRYERNGRPAAAFLMYSLQNFVNPDGKFSTVGNSIADYYLAYILSGHASIVKSQYQDALSPMDTLAVGMIDSNLSREQVIDKATHLVKAFNKAAAKHAPDPLIPLYADLMQAIEADKLYEDYIMAVIGGISNEQRMLTPAMAELLSKWYNGGLKKEK